MIAVIQRVRKAEVTIDFKKKRSIGAGIMLLLGIETSDEENDILWLANKTVNLRIFDDENGVMNHSLQDVGGEAMVISQFTLHASTKKGNRPSYIKAAPPEISKPIYEKFASKMSEIMGKSVVTGEFGANMQVSITNDGPVTIIIDTKDKK